MSASSHVGLSATVVSHNWGDDVGCQHDANFYAVANQHCVSQTLVKMATVRHRGVKTGRFAVIKHHWSRHRKD